MTYWKRRIRGNRSICWLLVCTLIVQLIVQLRLHVHHDVQAARGHDHLIDYHNMLADNPASDHALHKNTDGHVVRFAYENPHMRTNTQAGPSGAV